jgi:hypothetical protein
MANLYKIIVTNDSPEPQMMFFFQQPAVYSGSPTVYSNSLGSMQIAAQPLVGRSQITFIMELEFYAGVQSRPRPIEVGQANSGAIAEVPIDVSASGTEDDATRMSVTNGLSLSPPVNSPGVENGTFRIITPIYDPIITPYNAGLAAIIQGEIILSSFVTANPNQYIDVQPVIKFYVATGDYSAGTVIDFNSSSLIAAVCDATTGREEFFVTYNLDGTWTVGGTPSLKAGVPEGVSPEPLTD